jgi:hypothetical protein
MLNQVPRHEDVLGEWRYSSTHSLTSVLDGGGWSATPLPPVSLPPEKEPPRTHWIGGWVGPRAVLDAVSKKKLPAPPRDSNPDHPILQPIASYYSD